MKCFPRTRKTEERVPWKRTPMIGMRGSPVEVPLQARLIQTSSLPTCLLQVTTREQHHKDMYGQIRKNTTTYRHITGYPVAPVADIE